MYGASAQNEVINEMVQRRFYDVAVAQELKVAGYPRFEGVEEQDDKESLKSLRFSKCSLKSLSAICLHKKSKK